MRSVAVLVAAMCLMGSASELLAQQGPKRAPLPATQPAPAATPPRDVLGRLRLLEQQYQEAQERLKKLTELQKRIKALEEQNRATQERYRALELQRQSDQKRAKQLKQELDELKARSDELALEGGEGLAEVTYPAYSLSGFMDLTWSDHVNVDADHEFAGALSPTNAFMFGNLNVYNDIQLSPKWRVFFEIRFLFKPNGDETAIDILGAGYERWDTTTTDYLTAVFARDQLQGAPLLRWGGIEIERAWVDWNIIDFANIRVGVFLTPFGIWNIDHATPIQIGIMPPQSITSQIFPERQMGLQVYGHVLLSSWQLGYHLTVSNGRGPADKVTDYDNNKAFGGRVYVSYLEDLKFTAGVAWYLGEYTDIRKEANPAEEKVDIKTSVNYGEVAVGGDLSLRYLGIALDFEVLFRRVLFKGNHRPPMIALDPRSGLVPDHYQLAFYGTIGYRLPWIALTPFFRYDQFRYNDVKKNWSRIYSCGINYAIITPVVFKVHYLYMDLATIGQGSVHTLAAQLAVAF